MKSVNPREMLTTQEAADVLNVSKNFLEQARGNGSGPPFVKISPGAVRYMRAHLEAWVDERVHTVSSESNYVSAGSKKGKAQRVGDKFDE